MMNTPADRIVVRTYLAFKPQYRVSIVDRDALLLCDEDEYTVLEGTAVAQVGRCLLNGPRTVEDLVDQLEGTLTRDEVRALIAALKDDGFVAEQDPTLPQSVLDISAMLRVPPHNVADVLARTRVAVEGYGLEVDSFRAILEEMGIEVGSQANLAVVLADDYLHPGLANFNQAALQSGTPWMLVQPVGTVLFIGPIILPGRTGCWTCLALRLRHNRRADRFLQRHGDGPTTYSAPRALPSLTAMAMHRVAWSLMQWIVQGKHEELEGHLLSIDLSDFSQQRHPMACLPQCPSCGSKPGSHPGLPVPLALQSRRKSYTTDGGHRTLSPEEAFERYKHLIDPLTGVLRDLKRLETPQGGLMHTYVIKHSIVTQINTLEELRIDTYTGSSGKGMTEAQAKASALFEALERYSGCWRGDEHVVWNTYHDLKPAAIHLHTLMGFSDKQYTARHAWNDTCPSTTLHVPEPFDEHETIAWAPVRSLADGTLRYVPAAYGYFAYPHTEVSFCRADSNGNAAGITLEGAILQGFLEVEERDAVAIYFYNRLRRPGVDLRSFEAPYFHHLQHYYRTVLHRNLWVLDVTTDLGIPAMVAVSRRTDRHPEDIIMGFGCHLDPKIAIARALTEVSQILHNVLHERPDGTTRYAAKDPLVLEWLQRATLDDHPYLAPDNHLPFKTAADYPRLWSSDDLLEDVHTCVAHAQACGLDPYALNHTRADLDVPVVKVIVPGLVHYWRRLGARRLYEVPVKMGWFEQSLQEKELNPFSIVV